MFRSNDRRRAGFTLVEVSLSIVILGSILGTIAMVQGRGESAAKVSTAQTEANLKAARLLDRLVRDLQPFGGDGATPSQSTNLGTDTLTYQLSTGVVGGVVQWGTPRRLDLQLDAGELDNGVDDDGDGLVDERALLLTIDVGTADQRTTILSDEIVELYPGETANVLDDNGNGVTDERGFNLHRTGNLLAVRVAVAVPGPDGSVVTAALETSFRVRN
ncbi:MAG: type II secretion system protein [Kofleriaceae bacterium]